MNLPNGQVLFMAIFEEMKALIQKVYRYTFVCRMAFIVAR